MLHTNLMALCFIRNRSYGQSNFHIADLGNVDRFARMALPLIPYSLKIYRIFFENKILTSTLSEVIV